MSLIYAPSIGLKSGGDEVVVDGETAKLTCSITDYKGDIPKTSISWLNGNYSISVSETISCFFSRKIQIGKTRLKIYPHDNLYISQKIISSFVHALSYHRLCARLNWYRLTSLSSCNCFAIKLLQLAPYCS